MMTLENYTAMKSRILLFSVVLPALVFANISCKKNADKSANGNASNSNSSVASDETSTTPPFPTKEPERYQAMQVTTGGAGPEGASIPGLSGLANQEMPIARDGDKRRIETEMIPGVRIIYLQIEKGRYALFPAKKLYSEIKMDGAEGVVGSATGVPTDFTPDKLISTALAGSKFEKLGTETVNGRMTTKYRVTTKGGEGSNTSSQTIIWADESLGMPIKSESTGKDGSKFTWELRNIKLEVNASLFELPKDYRKVTPEELFSSALPSVNEVLGVGKDNKSTKKR